MTLIQYRGDLDGHGAFMEVMDGGGGTPLSAFRPCGMDITPRKALDIYGNLHLTIIHLLRGEQRDIEDKSQGWIRDIDNRMLRADITWMWPMLGWCIVILADIRLNAFVRCPPLRGMY